MKIILGSQSENRKHVLKEAGYDFEVIVSNIDEKAIRHENFYELPLFIAHAKTATLLPKIKEPAILIAADQVIVWNGELREKPKDTKEARRFLETFSNSEFPAECVNGVVVTNTETGKSFGEVNVSKVYFGEIPQTVIEKLLEEKSAFKWAGGFTPLHPLIARCIKKIEGTMDSVLGLPMDIVEKGMKETFLMSR